jgi:hypothetical protein
MTIRGMETHGNRPKTHGNGFETVFLFPTCFKHISIPETFLGTETRGEFTANI